MGTTEEATPVVNRDIDDKMRVTSRHWEQAKVLPRSEVLEVRNVDGRLDTARKERRLDECDPHGPGPSVTDHAGDECIDD